LEEIITGKVSFSPKNEYLRLNGKASNQVLVVEHLKVWTQLIVVAIPQFLVSNYLHLILPKNKPFANLQIH
jgi:hypothetical protein